MKSMEIPGVRGFVARALIETSDTPSKDLYGRASRRYPPVAELTVQQFHGRYVLPVRRELKRRPLRRPPLPSVPATFEVATNPTPEMNGSLRSRDAGRGRLSARNTSLLEALAGAGAEEEERSPLIGDSGARGDSGAPAGMVVQDGAGAAGGARTPKEGAPDLGARDEGAPESTATPTLIAAAGPGASPDEEPSSEADPRAATRTLFYQFALELELAATMSEFVDVIAGVDRYVDRAVAVTARV